jgi:hypothetical protein
MHYAGCVRGFESIGNFYGYGQQRLDFQRPAGDAMTKCDAVEIFHGNEGLPALLIDFLYCAHVGMVQGRRRPGLALVSTTPIPSPPSLSMTR